MQQVKLNLAFLREFKKDYRGFINQLIQDEGEAFVAKGMFGNLHFFADPDFVEHVLFEKHANYVRPPNKIVDHVLRDSAMILKEDQEQWRHERFNILNPLLGHKHVLEKAQTIIDTTAVQLETWGKYIDSKQPANIHELVSLVTIKNLCNLLFGKMQIDDAHLAHLIREFFYLFVANETSITKLAWKLPTEKRRRTKKVIAELHKLCDQIVDFCLADATPENLVHTLAKKYIAHYPNITKKDKLHLAGRVAVFLIGGFDNIASNLIWTLIYLSWYPLMGQKIYEELQSKVGSRPLQATDVDNLLYTRAVILESLRLSSGAFLPRMAMEDDEIHGYPVKKHDKVLLQIFYLHRSTKYWQNPEGFEPERFLKTLPELYRFVYLPFSAGPRGCIGKDFAMIQMVILVAMIAQKFRIYLAPYQVIDPSFQYLDPQRSKAIEVIIEKAGAYS